MTINTLTESPHQDEYNAIKDKSIEISTISQPFHPKYTYKKINFLINFQYSTWLINSVLFCLCRPVVLDPVGRPRGAPRGRGTGLGIAASTARF
jgi:hypothetical protein